MGISIGIMITAAQNLADMNNKIYYVVREHPALPAYYIVDEEGLVSTHIIEAKLEPLNSDGKIN